MSMLYSCYCGYIIYIYVCETNEEILLCLFRALIVLSVGVYSYVSLAKGDSIHHGFRLTLKGGKLYKR